MRILQLTAKPFYPTVDGGCAASLALFNQLLHEGFQVDVLTYSSQKHPFNLNHFPEEVQPCIKGHFAIDLSLNPLSALIALLKNKSYHLSRFDQETAKTQLVEHLTENQYDLIILDGLYSTLYLKEIQAIHRGQTWLRSHNIEGQIWLTESQIAKNKLKKQYLKKLGNQLLAYEKRITPKFDGVLTISKENWEFYEKNQAQRLHYFPYLPAEKNLFYDGESCHFFHFGSMNWAPNIDSALHLMEDIFPEIQKEIPNTKLKVAGSFMDEFEGPFSPSIEKVGYVENLPEFFASNGILLAPIRTGSGVRVKIVQALAQGVPVVTTQKGAEGIPFENGAGICIAENTKDFANHAINLAKNKEEREKLSALALANMRSWREKQNLAAIFAPDGQ